MEKNNKILGVDLNVILLGVVCLFPLFKISFNTYLIILWAFGAAILNWKKAHVNLKLKKNLILVASLPFLIIVVSLFYSNDIFHGVEKTIQALPILIFPVVVFLFYDGFKKKEVLFLIMVFSIVCVTHSIYLNYNFLSSGLFGSIGEIRFYNNPFRRIAHQLQWGDLHPTYVTLWYVMAIGFFASRIKKTKNILRVALLVCLILYLSFTILLLSSRIGILALSVIFLINVFFIRSAKIKATLILLLTASFFSALFFTPMLKSRFLQEFKVTKLAPPEGKRHNSINIRVGIYSCAAQIIKENSAFGVGIGDVQHELVRCYGQYNTDAYQLKNYNSHSYYLNVLLFGGIIGFLLFISAFLFFVFVSFRNKDVLYISFLTLILIFMITENILSRNHGVLFFGLFNTIFLNHYKVYANRLFGYIPQFNRKARKNIE
ncbi:O-antigen ligase family protein [Muricauda sp. CAU 1633]|uniref:O-antigen ligase family protein n=1 Tax=Allomuricauda sp. CAU 1633 TaxID=2816036 RepID=UPI001A8C4F58|nr:O-antigen ligase family protein [Muricauda sp. CAU 1633]MBO0320974.1 O-antigen ligase family protein [Muricauda sp. CAU 1633]